MSLFVVFSHMFCIIALLPNCFTVSQACMSWWLYCFWYVGVYIFIVSIFSASMLLEYRCLCNWANQSIYSLNLSLCVVQWLLTSHFLGSLLQIF